MEYLHEKRRSCFDKKQQGFNTKAINVMSFMLSFIGTTGIAFMYSTSAKTFIYVFGGGFGYFLVFADCWPGFPPTTA